MTSIRRYLAVRQLVAFGLLFSLGAGLLYGVVRAALLAEFDTALLARAGVIRAFTKQTAEGLHWESSPSGSAPFSETEDLGLFQLRLTNGQNFRRSAALGTNECPLPVSAPSPGPVFFQFRLPNGEPGRGLYLRYTPFMDRADHRPAHVRARHPQPDLEPLEADLVVAASRLQLDRTLRTVLTGLAVAGGFFLVGSVLIIGILLQRGLSPLKRLAGQAARIDASSLQTRLPTDTLPGELRPISERLNDLLARLEVSFQRERQFSADIAHELRTPIGELRTLAEVGLKLKQSDPAAHQDTLDIALQMEAIINRLFDIARCEQSKQPFHLESVAVAALVSDLWKTCAAKAQQRRLRVTFNLPAQAWVRTDAVLLRTILANLLSNAAEYTVPGGQLSVSLHPSGPRCAVTVSNSVENLTADDLPHLYERFWRKDPARSAPQHSGLGLALSQAVAHHLGCSLTAALPQPDLLAITLSGLEASSESKKA